MPTIDIKEEYFKKPIKEIKSELVFLTRIFKDNYMSLDLDTVIHYEEMIKILSEILLLKMKARIFPTDPDQKVIEINYNPEQKGDLTKKLEGFRNFGSQRKIKNNNIQKLRDLNFIFNATVLDSFSKEVLYEYCKELEIKGIYKKIKWELIDILIEYLRNNEIDTKISETI